MKNWSKEEEQELTRIITSGWDHVFPGYKWVTDKLNHSFNTERTVSAIKSKCKLLGI